MFVFNESKILIRENNINIKDIKNYDGQIINCSENLPNNWKNLPEWCDVKNINSGDEFIDLREIWHRFGYEIFARVGGAWQFANWFRNVKICSNCGSELTPSVKDYGRICKNCGRTFYAPLSPAVITAIEKDGKLLMAHNASWSNDRYSIIAGFVEPGEKLEQTVEREIIEEVGIKVKNIKYFGSQPWPFPNSLMFGFTAEWLSGEINPDGVEIVKAGWYTKEEIKNLNIPDGASIARRLIDNFVNTH